MPSQSTAPIRPVSVAWVIERPPHGLAPYGVDARLRALVAQVGHGGLCSELGHGSVLEDAARFGQERGERLWA